MRAHRRAVLISRVLLAIAAACGGGEESPSASSSSSSSGGSSGTSGGPGPGAADAAVDVTVPVGGACTSDAQCEGTCTGGKCAAPTTSDGKRSPSLGETDIDCGGPTAAKCAEGRGCAADGDCTTSICSAANKCVSSPSCRGTSGPSGVETCGTGDPGTPGANVESCCRSLPLPTTTTRSLDKYEITAGRFREFIAALAAANGGDPDVRTFAKNHATSNPTSQLGKIASAYPGLLDVLPNTKSTSAPVPLAVHLGAFPIDPMNTLDGCFVGPGSYGHATYWQAPEDLKPFGVGYPSNAPDGVRKYPREVLDTKPLNCVMPLMMEAFCVWDGGELAKTTDYREVFGKQSTNIGNGNTVFYAWEKLLTIGEFNWRNGNGEQTCTAPSIIAGWPNCQSPQPPFFTSPNPTVPIADDETPYISAPGRFPLDVTKARSANGEGWFDIGGDMLEAAWPTTQNLTASAVTDVCDSSTTVGGPTCTRANTGAKGVRRYTGKLPQIAMVGYSFEGHQRRSEGYLASDDGNETTRLLVSDLHPATFQYGKVGGRCARPTK